MAPSPGHLLLPKALRIVKFALDKSASIIRSKISQATQTTSGKAIPHAQPVRVIAHTQPLHPLAFLKQNPGQQNRWFATAVRNLSSTARFAAPKYERSNFPVSRTGKAISQRGNAPFASTLRPNLTGGALPRCAGGYSLGGAGKARHFSHTSGCQAQVISNVNAGIRAFLVRGGKAKYDGIDDVIGEKRFRCVSKIEDTVYRKWEDSTSSSTKGTNLEFRLSPMITALSPTFSSSESEIINLNTPNLLSDLGGDFARALRDLSLVLADLNKLATFGDLPTSLLHTPEGTILSVRFPGCDHEIVARLCDEVGIRRGLIEEDEGWDRSKEVEMALLFPVAPVGNNRIPSGDDESHVREYFGKPSSNVGEEAQQDRLDWRNNMLTSSDRPFLFDETSEISFEAATLHSPRRHAFSSSGYESLRESDFAFDDPYFHAASPRSATRRVSKASGSQEYGGLEAIYNFLRVCDDARR